jgi:outer membrane lipoprotein-sorting protein
MKQFIGVFLLWICGLTLQAQSADQIVAKLKSKLLSVKDYEAKGQLKTDVVFLKIPISAVKILYRYPDQFSIKKDGGISVLPKGGIRVNMNSLLADGSYTALDAGRINWKGADLAIIKLLPMDESGDIVLSTLYVDDKQMVIRKSVTSTKENGTYEMEMDYGKYAQWGLPDKAVMLFSTKDYKLPKGITFEYDAGVGNKPKDPKPIGKKGRIEITYSSYAINKGISKESFSTK